MELRHIQTLKSVLNLSLGLAIASCAFQIIGASAPDWVVFEMTVADSVTSSLKLGIWYMRWCYRDTCMTATWADRREDERNQLKALSDNDLSSLTSERVRRQVPAKSDFGYMLELYDSYTWTQYQIETSLAIGAAAIGAILVVYGYKRTDAHPDKMIVSGCFSMILSTVFVLIPVGQVAAAFQQLVNDSRDAGHDVTFGIPWALVISGIGGFLALLCALVMMAVAVRLSSWRQSDLGSTEGDLSSYYMDSDAKPCKYLFSQPYYPRSSFNDQQYPGKEYRFTPQDKPVIYMRKGPFY